MTRRSQEDLQNHPCTFKIKDFEKPYTGAVDKVKRHVPKLDENGNQVFKEVEVTTKKGCGCKSKDGQAQTETKMQKVPETVEITEDVPVKPEETKMVLCKLFGTVKASHCQNCHTYKVKPK